MESGAAGTPAVREGAAARPGQEGTMRAVEALYTQYATRVYNFMRYRAGDGELAQELTQMVFEKVIRSWHTYRPEKGEVAVWLFAIARNQLRDHYRKAWRAAGEALDEELPAAAPGPEDALQSAEERRRLEKALATLSKREQTAIALKYAAGLRNTQIAKIMKLSQQNTGVILHRSLQKLRALLEREET